MDIFDDTIGEIRKWFGQKEEDGKVRRFRPSSSPEPRQASAGDAHRARANPAIILKEETYLELGHPSVGSAYATLATHDPSLIRDGQVTLIGPDITETQEKMLPFAQIAIASCDGNIEDTSAEMDRTLHGCAQTDGYMLRSVPNVIWARVSKEAAGRGFSLQELGFRLVRSLKQGCPGIRSSELFFVTSNREDVATLDRLVQPARARLRKIRQFARGSDDLYECDSSLECADCPEKPVCDTIRDVIKIRKGERIITVGKKPENEKA